MKIKGLRLSTLFNLLSIMIAVFIYTFFKDFIKDWKIHPGILIYQFNISIGFTAAASISISYIVGNLKKLGINNTIIPIQKIKYFGLYGFYTALLHVFFSLTLIGKAIYPYLYELDGNLNTFGQLTILFGVASIGLLLMPALTSISSVKSAMSPENWRKYQRIGYYAIITTLGHIISQEIFKILMPKEWKYLMVPESIFICLIILIVLTLKVLIAIKKDN